MSSALRQQLESMHAVVPHEARDTPEHAERLDGPRRFGPAHIRSFPAELIQNSAYDLPGRVVVAANKHRGFAARKLRVDHAGVAQTHLYTAFYDLKREADITVRAARAHLADYFERYGTALGPVEKPADFVFNPLLGGMIREEDSPGNYTLRETTNGIEFLGYDAVGGEHVLGSFPRQNKRAEQDPR